jgi:DNA-binding IclR family transcriptional regulator
LLAELPDEELRCRYALSLDDDAIALLLAHLANVRERGWAMDDQETQAGLRCIGTVVRDHNAAAIAGLSISGPIARIGDDRVSELLRGLHATADSISRSLGYRSPGVLARI